MISKKAVDVAKILFGASTSILLIFYLSWEIYWYRNLGLGFIKWHTHLVVLVLIFFAFLLSLFLFKKLNWLSINHFNKLVLFFTSIFSLLFCVELIFTTTQFLKSRSEICSGYYNSPTVFDKNNSHHNWKNLKNEHTLKTAEFNFIRKTNSVGYSDKEWNKKDTSQIRILCTGDSFTEGDGAPQDSAYPILLEKILNETKTEKYSVMNAGTCGSDPFFNYKSYCDVLYKYQSNFILQTISANDILTDYPIRGGMERFQKDGVVYSKKSFWWEPIYALNYTSRLVFNALGWSEQVEGNFKLNEIDALKMKKDFKELFNNYSQFAKQNNATLIVVLLPLKEEVQKQKYQQDFSFLKSNIQVNLLSLYRDSLYINEQNFQHYYWAEDGHHNSKGYHAMATAIAFYFNNQH